jgi:hypothetical protein
MSKNRLEAYSDGVITIQNTLICAPTLDEYRITADPQLGRILARWPWTSRSC